MSSTTGENVGDRMHYCKVQEFVFSVLGTNI